MRRLVSRAGAALILVLASMAPGSAQEWRDHDWHGGGYHHDHGWDRGYHGGYWRDYDIRRFHERDLGLWREGRWFHGPHDGSLGWWWIVGGVWYFYPQPVYPFPDPYRPPVALGPAPPSGPVYYYCPAPPGYYPYVPSCPSGWRVTPAR